MCAIFGEINTKHDPEWVAEQTELASKRGKDLIEYNAPNVRLWHTRLATNDSQDTYPIQLDGWNFAMNGIVGEKKYKELQESKLDVGTYTVDSAYLLREFITCYENDGDWRQFDNDDYVFAFWMVKDDKLIIGSKDFPLYMGTTKDSQWKFSSFSGDTVWKCNNIIMYINLNDSTVIHNKYYFENLIYITKEELNG